MSLCRHLRGKHPRFLKQSLVAFFLEILTLLLDIVFVFNRQNYRATNTLKKKIKFKEHPQRTLK